MKLLVGLLLFMLVAPSLADDPLSRKNGKWDSGKYTTGTTAEIKDRLNSDLNHTFQLWKETAERVATLSAKMTDRHKKVAEQVQQTEQYKTLSTRLASLRQKMDAKDDEYRAALAQYNQSKQDYDAAQSSHDLSGRMSASSAMNKSKSFMERWDKETRVAIEKAQNALEAWQNDVLVTDPEYSEYAKALTEKQDVLRKIPTMAKKAISWRNSIVDGVANGMKIGGLRDDELDGQRGIMGKVKIWAKNDDFVIVVAKMIWDKRDTGRSSEGLSVMTTRSISILCKLKNVSVAGKVGDEVFLTDYVEVKDNWRSVPLTDQYPNFGLIIEGVEDKKYSELLDVLFKLPPDICEMLEKLKVPQDYISDDQNPDNYGKKKNE